MSPGRNPFILGSKVNGQGHEAQKQACVGLQTEYNIATYCVRNIRCSFLAALSRRTSHVSDIGFSMHHFPAADADVDRQFFFLCVEYFTVSQRGP